MGHTLAHGADYSQEVMDEVMRKLHSAVIECPTIKQCNAEILAAIASNSGGIYFHCSDVILLRFRRDPAAEAWIQGALAEYIRDPPQNQPFFAATLPSDNKGGWGSRKARGDAEPVRGRRPRPPVTVMERSS